MKTYYVNINKSLIKVCNTLTKVIEDYPHNEIFVEDYRHQLKCVKKAK